MTVRCLINALGRQLDQGPDTSLLAVGPVDPSFRALAGRFKLTVRRHTMNKYSFPLGAAAST